MPAGNAPNSIIIICKRYYVETLTKELELDNDSIPAGNSTNTSCQMLSEEMINTHEIFINSVGTELSYEDKRLSYLYWTLSGMNLQ